jgi:hypothetical protein
MANHAITRNGKRNNMSVRQEILKRNYYLYSCMPKVFIAGRTIDRAVVKAAKNAIKKVGEGVKLEQAMESSLAEIVKPVMIKYCDFGSGDTEPQWAVVDVMCELVSESLDIDVTGDWSLRGAL